MLQQWALLRVPHVPVQSIAEHSCLAHNFQCASIEQGPIPNANATFNIQRQFLSEKLENHCSLSMPRLNQSTYSTSAKHQGAGLAVAGQAFAITRQKIWHLRNTSKGGSWWNRGSETQRFPFSPNFGMEKIIPWQRP